MTATQPLLQATNVVAGYVPGVDILNGTTFHVGRGELVGIIGPNGAGKSTLLKAVFGLLPIRSGEVLLGGVPITNDPPHDLVKKGVGLVPQRENVFPRLTIRENLEMGAYTNVGAWDASYANVCELFPMLAAKSSQRAGALSGGERQMVAMARALMAGPSLLLLDEPSAGLSPLYQTQVFERVLAIKESGVAVAMVEQNARRCLAIADRGYVLDQGRDVYTGAGSKLLNDPRVEELYLGTLGRGR